MRRAVLLTLVLSLSATWLIAQDHPSADSLKKKYESSDINDQLRKLMSADVQYPDSTVLAPWHFINTFVSLPDSIPDFRSISLDIDVKTAIPDDFCFYISPFNASFNKMPFYCGIQTRSDGKSILTNRESVIGRGGIFSRWYERRKDALQTTGYYASSDAEGDFISVRNKFKWNKGRYRLTLYKSGYVPGKALPANFTDRDVFFSWGDYEQSWVTMKLEDLEKNKTTTIGTMAFPGKTLQFPPSFVIFLEQYGTAIDFTSNNRHKAEGGMDYHAIPHIRIEFGNIQVNGLPVKPSNVITYHNRTHHPEQEKIAMPIPLLSTVSYNTEKGLITCEIGNPGK